MDTRPSGYIIIRGPDAEGPTGQHFSMYTVFCEDTGEAYAMSVWRRSAHFLFSIYNHEWIPRVDVIHGHISKSELISIFEKGYEMKFGRLP